MEALTLTDALIVVDIQNDFLPGGALGIDDAQEIIPALLTYIQKFHARGLPIFLTRDWHPPAHCSFRNQGGPWPTHCVAGTAGSLPPPNFETPTSAVIIYKAIDLDREAYSAFQQTALNRHLQALGIRRLFIGGLATDYCVLNTVKDAIALGYAVCLLMDGIKAVNVQPDNGHLAEQDMTLLGALPIRLEMLPA
jgi:nicotinamidase/pyrazinamidase